MTTDAATAESTARGQTVIDTRVRQRLVERAVLSVTGVVARRTLVPGRTLPTITVGGQSDSPDIDVDVAASWPVDSDTLIDAVRRAVIAELTTAVGEHPASVNVRIARLEATRSTAQVSDAYATIQDAPAVADHHSRSLAPRGFAASTATGVLIAFAVIAVGAIAIRDAVSSGSDWISLALNWAAHQQWQWWCWPAAALGALAGLVLLIVAVKPRRRTHLEVGDDVWVTRSAAKSFVGES